MPITRHKNQSFLCCLEKKSIKTEVFSDFMMVTESLIFEPKIKLVMNQTNKQKDVFTIHRPNILYRKCCKS